MVPLKLALKNFLSYGQTTQYIDFEPYNLICLSGKNGHGKSALLDALTWVLWGYARKAQSGARADENLVRLGQTQMMVSLEFICKGAVYKVRRELNMSSNKVQTALDFGIIDPQTGAIRGLTDKTLRATQEKIIATIGLDYESFINSVFLRQGASNEFSKKSPKERKEILSSILGITQFELIKKRAVEKSRLLATQKDTLVPISERLSCEITHKEHLNHALTAALAQEKVLQETRATLSEQLQKSERAYAQHSHDKLQLQQISESVQKLDVRIQQGLQELRDSRAEFKKILSKRINGGSAEHQEREMLEKELEQLHTYELKRFELQQLALENSHMLQAHAARVQAVHTQHMHSLDMQLQQVTLRISLYEKRAREMSEKIDFLQQEIDTHKKQIGQNSSLDGYEKYREVYQKFVTQKNSIITKIQDYDSSLKTLSSVSTALCPTCAQELTDDKKNRICQIQHKDRSRAEHQRARFAKLLPALKEKIITMHDNLEKLKEVAHLERQITELCKEHTEIALQKAHETATFDTLLREKNQCVDVKILLLQDATYQKLFAESQKINEKLQALPAHTPERKRELTEKLKASKLENHLSPENITPLLQQIKKVAHLTSAHLKNMKQERQELTNKIAVLTEKIAQESSLEAQLQTVRHNIMHQTDMLNNLLREIGSYKEQLSRLESQQQEFARLSGTIKECSYQQELYQNIAQAVGKDGIQALLIEQALPEIEQEANVLLEKLTDGQAHVFIESLRDLKSGKSKETLDIHISDATGIRSYELFSGGEAFRIDFALRIALSKLLARRAGTTLQTLIIDEGFGSQDEEGLANIMEAIYKIQDDFAKIIIVSHLPYMKDHFPVHFIVKKTAQGSRVNIMEQG
ncbi:MAG: SMC family ATPase [Candidatus Babeliaceae bacterium]|nr:SMC family ATPase [Candidatus Babeliaceae bacterium]